MKKLFLILTLLGCGGTGEPAENEKKLPEKVLAECYLSDMDFSDKLWYKKVPTFWEGPPYLFDLFKDSTYVTTIRVSEKRFLEDFRPVECL